MVNSRVSEWNTLEADFIRLYTRLVDLGVEYRNEEVYLPEIEGEDLR